MWPYSVPCSNIIMIHICRASDYNRCWECLVGKRDVAQALADEVVSGNCSWQKLFYKTWWNDRYPCLQSSCYFAPSPTNPGMLFNGWWMQSGSWATAVLGLQSKIISLDFSDWPYHKSVQSRTLHQGCTLESWQPDWSCEKAGFSWRVDPSHRHHWLRPTCLG